MKAVSKRSRLFLWAVIFFGSGIKRKNGEKSPFRKNQKPTIKKSYE
jgi:hypothetical protein